MKAILSLIIFLSLIFPVKIVAEDLRFKSASVWDPIFEWSQYNEKDGKSVLLKDNTLLLQNDNPTNVTVSFMELPISLDEDDFTVNLLMAKTSIKDDRSFGIIFNYKNERNYTMLRFGEKQVTLYECERGEIAVIKRSIYKVNSFYDDLIKSDLEYKSDINNIVISIERKNGKIQFSINGLYICSLKNYTINYPNFGFAVFGNNKINIYGLEFAKADASDREE